MKNKTIKLISVLLVLVLSLSIFAACQNDDADTQATNEPANNTGTTDATEEPSVEVTPEPTTTRNGGWLDQITMIGVSDDAAVTQLEAGAIDIFAGSLTGDTLSEIQEAGLDYVSSTGLSYEIMVNNADTSPMGAFNPFSIQEVRQAMQKLIDRNYVAQEIFSGAAIPRYFPISSASVDYARYVEFARAVEATMGFDEEAALATIETALTTAGLTKDAEGLWLFNGEPIVVKILIRTEDGKRQPLGDYVANQVEKAGITVDRFYGTSAECGAICWQTDPWEGQWHMYTGAWGASGLARDSAIYFHDYDSPDSRMSFMLSQQAVELTDEYYQVLDDLSNSNYTTIEERGLLFEKAFPMSAEESNRIWIADGLAYTPWNTNVTTSYNLSAGVDGDSMTAYTIRFKDEEGGSMVWGNQSPPLVEPINPINGSNWTYDMQYTRMTQDYGKIADPFTGLFYAKRAEKAELVVQTGLPIGVTYDWIDLSFEDEIMVPADTMSSWDVETQTWKLSGPEELQARLDAAIAALAAAPEEEKAIYQTDVDSAQADVDRGYRTAKTKSVIYYPADMTENKWHDGTNFSLADIMMAEIMQWELSEEASPLYDEFVAASLISNRPFSRGWRIVSEDPIVLELYSESYLMDAESDVFTFWPGYPLYNQGQASWYEMAVSNKTVIDGTTAYSQGIATKDGNEGMEWMNWLAGPSLEFLEAAAQELAADSVIPFEPTLGKYVTADEAAAAYTNLLGFYGEYGHFLSGMGPYILSNVMSVEETVVLIHNENYRGSSDEWSFLSTPKLSIVEIDGPASVSADADATFEVFVSFGADFEAYPIDEIAAAKYLLFDATGAVYSVNAMTSTEDGKYEIVLSADTIAKLGTGSCKIEVVISPKTVAAPSIVSTEFVVD